MDYAWNFNENRLSDDILPVEMEVVKGFGDDLITPIDIFSAEDIWIFFKEAGGMV
jgi:hypothetical protein